MRLSRYLATRKKRDVVAVFHELHPVPLIVPKATWNALVAGEGLNDQLLNELQARKLITTVNEDDEERSLAFDYIERTYSDPSILYLLLSEDCNFSCSYCPVPRQTERRQKSLMSPSVAIEALDKWSKYIDLLEPKDRYVIFYGGEPLLNPRTLRASIEMASVSPFFRGEHNHLMLVTNGWLIDEDLARYLAKKSVHVCVALDVNQVTHDGYRITRDGEASWDRSVKALQTLTTNGVETSVSTTVLPESIDGLPDFRDFISKIGVSTFGVNFLRGDALRNYSVAERQEYNSRSARALVDLWKNRNGSIPEFQMQKKESAYRTRNFFPFDCTCYGTQVVVRADGALGNCPFSDKAISPSISNMEFGEIPRHKDVATLRHRLSVDEIGFDAKSLHGGGCSWGCGELDGDCLSPDYGMRILAKEALDVLIWS